MMKLVSIGIFCLLFLFFSACSKTEKVYIVCDLENSVIYQAGLDLSKYLSEVFPGNEFEISGRETDGSKNIVLKISGAEVTDNDETYRITGTDNRLLVTGKTPRALLNGVYGLLEETGFGFYLSFESTPPAQGKIDFTRFDFSDSPQIEERIIFNWHNFLSGCSSWDFPEWAEWIDRSSRMKYNSVMVHAYGNNPMFTYSFNGIQKRTDRLPSTRGGRDYGVQQVNDVRRLHGGDIFDHPVFGAEVSKLETNDHVEAVQELMGRVFDHAKEQGMKICFAIDIDTNPANPQELITTLPLSARFSIPLQRNDYSGRFFDTTFWLANPDTPEGYAFYRAQLVSLLELYPQIGQVALWMRHRGSFEWLSLEADQLPSGWQTEYKEIIRMHPRSAEWDYAPGRFALGKVIEAFQRVLQEIGREDVELKAGSWTFDWMDACDVLFPEGVGFIGLDYNILHGTSDIDLPEQQERLAGLTKNRPVTPVFWAHHDDGGYIGRPYVPINELHSKLERVGATSFGIIHWTTWPLDPYFKNMGEQVWKRSLNQDYATTVQRMAVDLFGTKQTDITGAYLYDWATTAPMMGRETREWLIDVAFTDSMVQKVEEGCLRRLSILGELDRSSLTDAGKNYMRHFEGMETFYREFFRNENTYQNSLKYLAEGKLEKALEAIRTCRPEELTALYSELSAEKEMTKGEKGMVITFNLCWLPFIENQRQSLGESPVRYNFAPTVHPKFGQGILRTTFHMDPDQNIWRNIGEEETGASAYDSGPDWVNSIGGDGDKVFQEICSSGIQSNETIRFAVQPFMADIRPVGPTRDLISGTFIPGNYRLQLLFSPVFDEDFTESVQELFIYDGRGKPATISEQIQIIRNSEKGNEFVVKVYELNLQDQGNFIIELKPVKGEANICGAVLQQL